MSGFGTFSPIESNNIYDHTMHKETYFISKLAAEQLNRAKTEKKYLIAVGTTVTRCLESNTKNNTFSSGQSQTDLYITPGHDFKSIDVYDHQLSSSKIIITHLNCIFHRKRHCIDLYNIAINCFGIDSLVMGRNANHLMTIRILFIIFTLTTPIICTPNYMPGFPEFIPPIIPTLNPTQTSTENTYPNVNSNGFVEMKLSGRDYTDDLTKLDTIRQDPMYKKIPNEIMKGSPKLENRYNVELEGHLDKDTEVKYSIQKGQIFQEYTMYTFEKKQLNFNSEILIPPTSPETTLMLKNT